MLQDDRSLWRQGWRCSIVDGNFEALKTLAQLPTMPRGEPRGGATSVERAQTSRNLSP